MGTLHAGMGGLHGITVVVDTVGPEIWIGRCWEATDAEVTLLDADVHRAGEGGMSKEEFVARAARLGVWKKHARVLVPGDQVASIRPLGEIALDRGKPRVV
jgi:hypothetical protein